MPIEKRRATILPSDVFVVSSPDPTEIMREYARITGYPELPALWTLGYMHMYIYYGNRLIFRT